MDNLDDKCIEFTAKREMATARKHAKASRIVGAKEEVKSLNTYLDKLQHEVYEAHYFYWTVVRMLPDGP